MSKYPSQGQKRFGGVRGEWTELNEMSRMIAQAANSVREQTTYIITVMMKHNAEGTGVFTNEEFQQFGAKSNRVVELLKNVQSSLQEVHAKHQHRTGAARDDNDIMQAMSIAMEYNNVHQEVMAVVFEGFFDMADIIWSKDDPQVDDLKQAATQVKNLNR